MTVDSVTVVDGDRVLVKNQTNPIENGIWIAHSGAWTRATDMDATDEVLGAQVPVVNGNLNDGTVWMVEWWVPGTHQVGSNQITFANLLGDPAGKVEMFAGTTAPYGYLLCDGSAQSRTIYGRLFAVIGTLWGAGDGSTTFNLPDMRRRFPWGAGINVPLGYSDGVTDSTTRTPIHDHGGTVTGGGHQHNFDINSVSNAPTTGSTIKITAVGGSTTNGTTAGANSHTHTVPAALQPGSSDASTAMPNLALNFIIKW